jgi:hypothetical protein
MRSEYRQVLGRRLSRGFPSGLLGNANYQEMEHSNE